MRCDYTLCVTQPISPFVLLYIIVIVTVVAVVTIIITVTIVDVVNINIIVTVTIVAVVNIIVTALIVAVVNIIVAIVAVVTIVAVATFIVIVTTVAVATIIVIVTSIAVVTIIYTDPVPFLRWPCVADRTFECKTNSPYACGVHSLCPTCSPICFIELHPSLLLSTPPTHFHERILSETLPPPPPRLSRPLFLM